MWTRHPQAPSLGLGADWVPFQTEGSALGHPCLPTALLGHLPSMEERQRQTEAGTEDRDGETDSGGRGAEAGAGRAATSPNINQLEKQEGRPGPKACQAGLFFQNERPREELGVGGGSDSSLENGLHPSGPGSC